MSVLRSLIISFSMYSRIPMPIFNWDEKDMKHVITFLPFIGAVIGAIDFAIIRIGSILELPCMVMTLLLTLIPILVTGGFHIDGFMDVQDALKSYQSKEKKLEIMKDPHIGAFAVISVISLGLIWITALYLIVYNSIKLENPGILYVYSMEFTLVRAACGITCLIFNGAKKDGMLNMETGKAGRIDIIFLFIQAFLAFLVMLLIKPVMGAVLVAVLFLYLIIYKETCDKNFGGVTGDTAGYFIVTGECILTVALCLISFWG